jgi:hypothetical protein
MQLESTLFAIAVIQVKPQLEKVLNLPLDSLTKEIELTQDLLKLFQEYQTSADLLSFDKDLIEFGGVDGDVKTPDMIKAVRSNADKVLAMIKREQDKQIEREKTQQEYERAKLLAENTRHQVGSSMIVSAPPPAPKSMAMPSMPMKKMAKMSRSAVLESTDYEMSSPLPPPPVAMSMPPPAAEISPAALEIGSGTPSNDALKPAEPTKDVSKPSEAAKS